MCAKKKAVEIEKDENHIPVNHDCPKCKAKGSIYGSAYLLRDTIECAICGFFYELKTEMDSVYQQLGTLDTTIPIERSDDYEQRVF